MVRARLVLIVEWFHFPLQLEGEADSWVSHSIVNLLSVSSCINNCCVLHLQSAFFKMPMRYAIGYALVVSDGSFSFPWLFSVARGSRPANGT